LVVLVDRQSAETFTGLAKPLYFSDNKTRFVQFQHKIVYASFPGREPAPNESPFDVESDQRTFMTQLLRSHVNSVSAPPLVVFSDIDEIPSSHTLHLLRKCSFPSPIHLQLRNYLYSFEWPISANSWRAQVHEWDGGSHYRHSQASDNILADSGWHCRLLYLNSKRFSADAKDAVTVFVTLMSSWLK
jgi:beta-1,4-mannosyl-glycoprotein beta-1,4-N-acetylglucosaminyltransferase